MTRYIPHLLLILLGAAALTIGIAELRTARAAPAAIATDPPVGADGPAAIEPPPSAPAEPTIDEAIRLWRGGTPLAAIMVIVYIGLLAAVRFDPRRALRWTGSAGAIALLVESLRAGVTPTMGMWLAAAGTLVALWAPGAVQTLTRSRAVQAGSARLGPLIAVALVGLAAAIALQACGPLEHHGRATTGDLVDCSLVAIGDHADELEVAIRDRDWTRARALVRQLGYEVGGCALRRAIERLLGGAGVAAGSSAEELRAGWERLRADVLGGRRYLVEVR